MELDVTAFIMAEDMWDLSHSAAEHGCSASSGIAAKATWQAAMEAAERHPLVTDANRAAFESWIGDCGAWERDEIAAWTLQECTALLLQFVAGDYREQFEDCTDTDEIMEAAKREDIGGRLTPYHADGDDLAWSYYVGC